MKIEQAIQAHQSWLEDTWKKLEHKMPYAVQKAREVSFIPYTTRDGAWVPPPMDGISWWTNGFWPATMWQMYLRTGDELYRAEAQRTEEMLDDALREFDHLHHDLGFMWLISAGVNYRLTGDDTSRKRTLLAANLLAGRYNPLGFIRAWNSDRVGWAIIDCMMNLNLLYFAAEHTGDPRFRQIAMNHADTTLRHFVRQDGSVEHIVVFDPETMEVLEKPAGQGCAPGSSWSRGQAWALYGFMLSYLHTGKQEYLDAAKSIAHYFISCVRQDYIPRCDFRQPPTPDLRDNVAGGIASCALIELAKALPDAEGGLYLDAAIQLLRAADASCADWGLHDPAILQKCTGSYSSQDQHITMNYGDYFMIEALAKLSGEKLRFW